MAGCPNDSNRDRYIDEYGLGTIDRNELETEYEAEMG